MRMSIEYRPALPSDIDECIDIRGKTRENSISALHLAALGITSEIWGESVKSGVLLGFICCFKGQTVGYCFGERGSGEVLVLALLPDFEGLGLGRRLLDLVVQALINAGNTRLFLSCSADPGSRSYGFYRRLGWRTTNQIDQNGDEILEYQTGATDVV